MANASRRPLTESQSRNLSATFETERIRTLQDERVSVQKRTFTKWVNSYLNEVNMQIKDLFTDLSDGSKLMKLVEILAGVQIGKPNRGLLRVHKVENVSRVLKYLSQHVQLENIGAEDIVDGNPRLILGLIWTIILRFQIQRYLFEDADGAGTDAKETVQVAQNASQLNSQASGPGARGADGKTGSGPNAREHGDLTSVKQALLAWSNNILKGYNHVDVRDFGNSWRDGMAFNALVHKARPELVDYDHLDKKNHRENLANAFELAEKELNIPRLLDPEDVDVDRPDDRSIMTYVSSYYKYFATKKKELNEGKRLAKMITDLKSVDTMKNSYETDVARLLSWIAAKTRELRERNFPNSSDGVQQLLAAFKKYRTDEKPAKLRERGELEVLLFSIYAQQKALHLRTYAPPEGKSLHDVETAWTRLEKEEHERELALHAELLRQERLEQIATKFRKKAAKRASYLDEANRKLDAAAALTLFREDAAGKTGDRLGELNAFERAAHKKETMLTDISEKDARFQLLAALVRDLFAHSYARREEVRAEEQNLASRWRATLARVAERHAALNELRAACGWLRDLHVADDELSQLAAASKPIEEQAGQPKTAAAVDELLARLTLLTSQLDALATRGQQLAARLGKEPADKSSSSSVLQRSAELLAEFNQRLAATRAVCGRCSDWLRVAKRYHDWGAAADEEEAWLTEKTSVMRSDNIGRDLNAINTLLKRHNEEVAEIEAHKANQSRPLLATAAELQTTESEQLASLAENVARRRVELESRWRKLEELLSRRKTLLEDAAESHRYYAEANDAESWLREKLALCAAVGFGSDESSAQALLARHSALQREINTFEDELKRLTAAAQSMTTAAHAHHTESDRAAAPPKVVKRRESSSSEEDEMVEVESEVEEEREVEKEVPEERLVPQVVMVYTYKGDKYEAKKGETLHLLERSNADWWAVRNANRQDGYVPASYVREIEPRRVVKTVKKRVPQIVKVPVKRLVPKHAAEQRKHVATVKRAPSARSEATLHFDRANLERRQTLLSSLFSQLKDAATRRDADLHDAMQYYRFVALCELFEAWIGEKERQVAGKNAAVDQANLDESRKRYEKFIDDVAANGVRLREIGSIYEELLQRVAAHASDTKAKPAADAKSQSFLNEADIKQRYKKLQERYAKLNSLRAEWDKQLQGASSLDYFDKYARETEDWINEKREVADRLLAEVKALPKSIARETLDKYVAKLHDLELQTVPVDEKLAKVHLIAENVKERDRVKPTVDKLEALWTALVDQINEIRSKIQDAEKATLLKRDAEDVESRLATANDRLSTRLLPRDVRQAERALYELGETRRELVDAASVLDQLESRAKDLEETDPDAFARLNATIRTLRAGQSKLLKKLAADEERLSAIIELLRFARECDRVDSKVSSIDTAMLPFGNLSEVLRSANSVELEKMAKQLDTNYALLNTFDSRTQRLAELAKQLGADRRLVESDDSDAKKLRDEILAKYDATTDFLAATKKKNRSAKKRVADAISCRSIRDDGEQLLESVLAKFAHLKADDSALVDEAALLAYARKFDAAQAEMRVARGRLEQIDADARAKIDAAQQDDTAAAELNEALTTIKSRFGDLESKAAKIEEVLNNRRRNLDMQKTLASVQASVDRLMRQCSSDRPVSGSDQFPAAADNMRQLKKALADHIRLEKEAEKLANDLADRQDNFAAADAVTQKRADLLNERVGKSVAPLLSERRKQLEASLAVLEWKSAAQQQLSSLDALRVSLASSYVSEYVAARHASEDDTQYHPIKSFTEAQQAAAKVRGAQQTLVALAASAETLSASAQPLIDSAGLATAQRSAVRDLMKLKGDLDAARVLALEKVAARLVETGFLADLYQLVAVDVHETNQSIAECAAQLGAQSTPRDLSDVERLLAKCNALHTRIETIGHSIDNDLSDRVDRLAARATHKEDAEVLAAKFSDTRHRYQSIASQSDTIRHNLEEKKFQFAYHEKADEFEEWLLAQLQELSVENFGNDLDEYEVLRNHFYVLANQIEGQAKNFAELTQLAASAPSEAPLFASEIAEKQEQLDADWRGTLDTLAQRKEAFEAMREVLQFARDANQLAASLTEKADRLLPSKAATQLGGRDIETLERAMKRHEAIELELDAVENDQLASLLAKADQLSKAGLAARVQPTEELLRAAWQTVQSQAENTASSLAQAHNYSRFVNAAREKAAWCDEQTRQIDSALARDRELLRAVQTRDTDSLQQDLAQLALLRASIANHDAELRQLLEEGEQLVNEDHYASDDIQDRCDRLLDAKNDLVRRCDMREKQLTEINMLSKFVRDASAAQRQNAALVATLRSTELGDSLEQTDRVARAHRELVATRVRGAAACNKFQELIATGESVQRIEEANKNEASAKRVADLVAALRSDRAQLEQLCDGRQKRLDEQEQFLRFQAAAADIDGWLDERLAALSTRESDLHSIALSEKVRLLRVHHVFEAEIVKNRPRVEAMKRDAESLLTAEKHPRAPEIQAIINKLIEKWNKLLHDSDSRAQFLEEAESLLRFEEEHAVVDGWVREKELLIAADQLGTDYEHCEALQRRVNETVGGRVVDERRVADLHALAQSLSAGAADAREGKALADRADALRNRWNTLQTDLAAYKTRLAAAHELHAFRRDVDELDDRITSNIRSLAAAEAPVDLVTAERLLALHAAVERACATFHKQLDGYDSQARRLGVDQSSSDETLVANQVDETLVLACRSRLQAAKGNEEKLNRLADERKSALKQQHSRFRFVRDANAFLSWTETFERSLLDPEVRAVDSLQSATGLLAKHKEAKGELDGRSNSRAFDELVALGAANGDADCARLCDSLKSRSAHLKDCWTKRLAELKQCVELHQFAVDCERERRWFDAQSQALDEQRDVLGSSLAEVETLSRAHENFTKSIDTRTKKLDLLADWSKRVVGNASEPHYASSQFSEAVRELCESRLAALRAKCAERADRLREARVAQLYYRDVRELTSWMDAKLQHVADSNYSDLANISMKRSKHEVLVSEVRSREAKLDELRKRADEFLSNGHSAREEIKKHRDEAGNAWDTLLAACAVKSRQFEYAERAVEFQRDAFDFEQTLDALSTRIGQLDVANQGNESISTISRGSDQLKATENSLDRIGADFERCVERKSRLAERLERDFHQAEGIDQTLTRQVDEKLETIAKRVDHDLPNALDLCRNALATRRKYTLLLIELQQLTEWIEAQHGVASKLEYGATLQSAKKAQRRLETLQHAFDSRLESQLEPALVSAASFTQDAAAADGQRKADIDARSTRLRTMRDTYSKLLSELHVRLTVAVDYISLLDEVNDARDWLDDHAISDDVKQLGSRSADDNTEQLKRLDELAVEASAVDARVGSLRERFDTSKSAVRNRLGAEKESNLRNAVDSLSKAHQSFRKSLDERREQLEDTKRFFELERRADELLALVNEQARTASSINYGHDLEHCRALEAEHAEFVQLTVNTATNDRVLRLQNEAAALLADNSHRSESLQACIEQLNAAWQSLRSLCAERRDALANAKQIHAFTKQADELLELLEEKEVELDAQERNTAQSLAQGGLGVSLSSPLDMDVLQSLSKDHAAIEHDLSSIQQRVDACRQDYDRLRRRFAEAETHLTERFSEVESTNAKLAQRCRARKQRLASFEQLRFYLVIYSELMQFCDSMLARVSPTSNVQVNSVLATLDVDGAQQLVAALKDAHFEIEAKRPEVERCVSDGIALQQTNSLLADELAERVQLLREKFFTQLAASVAQRGRLYDKLLDLVNWKRDVAQFESWLTACEPRARVAANESWLDASTNFDVAPLIGELDVLIKSVSSQEDSRLELVKRRTLVEIELEQTIRQEQESRDRAKRDEERALRLSVRRLASMATGKGSSFAARKEKAGDKNQPLSAVPLVAIHKSSFGGSDSSLHKTTEQRSTSPPADDRNARREKRVKVTPSFSVRINPRVQQTQQQQQQQQEQQPQAASEDNAKTGGQSAEVIVRSASGVSVTAERPRSAGATSSSAPTTPISPGITKESELERKAECGPGGKRSMLRNWKSFYTVLFDASHRYLQFYRDRNEAKLHTRLLNVPQSNAASSPLLVQGAMAYVPSDYTKRKYVFRLKLRDQSEYLFSCRSVAERDSWIAAISQVSNAAAPLSGSLEKVDATLHPVREFGVVEEEDEDANTSTSTANSKDKDRPASAVEESPYENVVIVKPPGLAVGANLNASVRASSPHAIPSRDVPELYDTGKDLPKEPSSSRSSVRFGAKGKDKGHEDSTVRLTSLRRKPAHTDVDSEASAAAITPTTPPGVSKLSHQVGADVEVGLHADVNIASSNESPYVNVMVGSSVKQQEHEAAAIGAPPPSQKISIIVPENTPPSSQASSGSASAVDTASKYSTLPHARNSEETRDRRSTLKVSSKHRDGKSPKRSQEEAEPPAVPRQPAPEAKPHKSIKFPWSKK